jgi:cell division protein FtsI (penicillin-binding protein 3)
MNPAAEERRRNIRAALVGVGLIGLLLALSARLYSIQVRDNGKYRAMALGQHRKIRDLPPYRGDILSSDGKILSRSVTVDSIYAEPGRLVERDLTLGFLSEVLDLRRAEHRALARRLADPRRAKFAWVKRRVKEREARKIRALRIKGIGFRKEWRRMYPLGKLAGHVVGLAGVDGNGLSGIELAFEDELRGVEGFREYEADSRGRGITTEDTLEIAPCPGLNLYLTIHSQIQRATEAALDGAFKRWKPVGAWAIVVEPGTGRVLAMASRPGFDPATPGVAPTDHMRNRVLTDYYEPGSTLKPIVAAMALQAGVVRPEEAFYCENGAWRYRGRTLHDHHPYGRLSFPMVIIKSSNIGMGKIGLRLSPRLFSESLARLGFGRRTGIRLPGEARGKVTSLRRWSYYTSTSVPMGQEIGVTALQLVMAYAALANGGDLFQPQILERLVDHRGREIYRFTPRLRTRAVFSRRVAREIMTPILVRVVEEGTGKKARIEGIRVAGKTGTSQKLEGGRYSHRRHIASFVAFAPAEAPELCVLVAVDEPKGAHYGGTVAAPVVREILFKSLAFTKAKEKGRAGGTASATGGEDEE